MNQNIKDAILYIAILAKELDIPLNFNINLNGQQEPSVKLEIDDEVVKTPATVETESIVNDETNKAKREMSNTPDAMRRKRAEVRSHLKGIANNAGTILEFPTKKQISDRFSCDPFHNKTADGRLTNAVYEREKIRFYENKSKQSLF